MKDMRNLTTEVTQKARPYVSLKFACACNAQPIDVSQFRLQKHVSKASEGFETAHRIHVFI